MDVDPKNSLYTEEKKNKYSKEEAVVDLQNSIL
jgi:hypothetical protein